MAAEAGQAELSVPGEVQVDLDRITEQELEALVEHLHAIVLASERFPGLIPDKHMRWSLDREIMCNQERRRRQSADGNDLPSSGDT